MKEGLKVVYRHRLLTPDWDRNIVTHILMHYTNGVTNPGHYHCQRAQKQAALLLLLPLPPPPVVSTRTIFPLRTTLESPQFVFEKLLYGLHSSVFLPVFHIDIAHLICYKYCALAGHIKNERVMVLTADRRLKKALLRNHIRRRVFEKLELMTYWCLDFDSL